MKPNLATEIVDYIFSEGGPLQQCLNSKHRKTQADLAHHRAEFIGKGRGDKRGIAMVQADTGIGKTLAALIPAAVYARLDPNSPRRSVIATGTISLREQMLNDTDLVNEVVGMAFAHFGLDPLDRPISIKQRPSYTAYICKDKANRLGRYLGKQTLTAANDSDIQHALDFVAFVAEQVGRQVDPTFDDWFSDDRSLGRLPVIHRGDMATALTEQDLSLDPAKARNAKKLIPAFASQIDEAKKADIMIVTHAMLLWNNITWGSALGTKAAHTKIENDEKVDVAASDFKDLLIDEADNLLSLTMNSTDYMVSLNDVSDFLDSLPERGTRWDKARSDLNYIIKSLETIYPKSARARPAPVRDVMADSDVSWDVFKTRLTDFIARLDALVEETEDRLAQLQYESLGRPLQSIDKMVGLAGTSRSDLLQFEWTNSRLYVEGFYADPDNLRLGIKPTQGNNLANRTWLWEGVNSFDTVYLMSATLASAKGDMREFGNRIGVYESLKAETRTFGADSNFGRITDIFYASSDAPLPMLATPKAKPATEGENDSGATYDNPDYLKFIAMATLEAHKRDGRSLLLLSSSTALEAVRMHLLAEGCTNLYVQSKGMKTGALMKKFAADPNGLWIGMKWAGENFVDDDGKSLLSRVIIGKMPFAVPNFVHDFSQFEYMNIVEDGVRKFKQGIGRGIRDHLAEIELWILDPRFPKPQTIKGWDEFPADYNNAYFKSVAGGIIPHRFLTGLFPARQHLIEWENGEVTISQPPKRLDYSDWIQEKVA